MAVRFTRAVIVGVGLIGGSLGMILRRKALAASVVGVGRRVENLKTAVAQGGGARRGPRRAGDAG